MMQKAGVEAWRNGGVEVHLNALFRECRIQRYVGSKTPASSPWSVALLAELQQMLKTNGNAK